MNRYNEYISMTRSRLRNYNNFLVSIQNKTEDIAYEERMLDECADMAAPVSKYGGGIGGGAPELTPVERAADKRIKRTARLSELRRDKDEMMRIVSKIDYSVGNLKDEEAEIIREYYFNGKSWETIGYEHSMSERWAREKGNRAIKELALMMFGLKAVPRQINFVFTE